MRLTLGVSRYAFEMTRFTLLTLGACVMSACNDPLTPRATSSPTWEVKNAANYAETAAGLPPDEVFGWHLVVVGDTATWRECTAIDRCSKIERSRLSKDLVAVAQVAKASVEGEAVEVLKLSLTARPTYVVPTWKNPPSR